MQRTRSHLNYERLSPYQHHYFKLSLDFVPWRAGIILKLGQSTILKLGIGWVVSGLSKISRETNNWKVEERTVPRDMAKEKLYVRHSLKQTSFRQNHIRKLRIWKLIPCIPTGDILCTSRTTYTPTADISRCISICTNSILSNNYMRYAFYSCFIPDKVK